MIEPIYIEWKKGIQRKTHFLEVLDLYT